MAKDWDNHDFGGGSLVNWDLRGAHLHNARHFGDMRDADLRGAHLEGADLSDAKNLDKANLLDACYDASTRWPPGLDPRGAGAVPPAAVSSSGAGPNVGGMPQGIR